MREVDRINKKLWLLNHNLVGNQKGGRNVRYKNNKGLILKMKALKA
jgi:hypothetical protein